MSNSHTIEFILKKFPIQENVEWSKRLTKTEDAMNEKLFPEFEMVRRGWNLVGITGSPRNRI